MKKRIMAIAAAVILVAAFVFMAVPAGAAPATFNNGFLNDLSQTSILDKGVFSGVRSSSDTSVVFQGERLRDVSADAGVVVWCFVQHKTMHEFECVWSFDRSDSASTPPYPSYRFGLLQQEIVSIEGIKYDLYGYVFSPAEWQTMIGDQYSPDYASFRLLETTGVEDNFYYYVGLNTIGDFYSAVYTSGAAALGGDSYRGIYAGADWKLRINLNVTYEGKTFWETDIDPVARNGYIDVDAAYSAAVQRFYSETNLGGLNIVSVLIQCDFYSPYELGLGPILTSGSVDTSISLELLTANGNPYKMNAIEDGGWIKWDNENVSRLEQFTSFRYLVPIALASDSLRFYTSGVEFDAGYNAGYDDGFEYGKTVGSESGYDQGYVEGEAAGKDFGYNEGYVAGEDDGYDKGKDEGYLVGFGDGYIDGAAAGRDEGYRDGYSAGLQVSENTEFKDLIFAVVDTPVQAFLGLLSFDLLGVNVANFLLSLISAFFALKILKMIFAF